MTGDTQKLIRRFLAAPEGDEPQDVAGRLLHWREVVHHPENFTEDHHEQNLKALQRNAKQNIRRLIQRHPEVAAQIVQVTA